MNQHIKVICMMLVIIMLACLATVWAKLVLQDVPPFTFVWLMVLFGIISLTVYAFVIKRERLPIGLGIRCWFYLIATGILYYCVYRYIYMVSLEKIDATTHVYIINFTGLVTMGLSSLLLREFPTTIQVLGAVIALLGLWLYFDQVPVGGELQGILLLLIGVLCLALTNIFIRLLGRISATRLSSTMVAVLTIWIGGLPLLVLGLIIDFPPAVTQLNSWLVIVFNGIVVLAGSMVVWSHALRTLRSYEASILASSGVIFTALFSIPILGDRLETHEIAGIAVMLVGLTLTQIRRSLRR
ncbi:DMT family transporter [Marinicella sp. W31]|uniref:DMT family transporter n=1 Tax=Marinicella sp. W31 TaxID=3023713 RepID=UPI003756B512